MRDVPGERAQSLESIDSRGLEADRAGVRVVFADRRNLADPETKGRGLDQHLRVEDEVVAVLEKRDRFEKTTRVGAIAGVILGQVQTEHAIFGPGQEAIADALPPGHAGLRRIET